MSTPEVTTPAAPAAPQGNPTRKKALTGVAGLVVVAGIAYAAYWALVLNHYESTDNAYVQAPTVQITAQQPGTVLELLVDDTDAVKAFAATRLASYKCPRDVFIVDYLPRTANGKIKRSALRPASAAT